MILFFTDTENWWQTGTVRMSIRTTGKLIGKLSASFDRNANLLHESVFKIDCDVLVAGDERFRHTHTGTRSYTRTHSDARAPGTRAGAKRFLPRNMAMELLSSGAETICCAAQCNAIARRGRANGVYVSRPPAATGPPAFYRVFGHVGTCSVGTAAGTVWSRAFISPEGLALEL